MELLYIFPKGTIFISHTQDKRAQADTFGRFKPLSNISFNCSLNSLNYAGALLYGGKEIGRVS